MKHYVTIGVAGHVDHGKTSFVKQITGIDTDRHPEEKIRGLSLEAGIACWPRPDGTVAAFVDVPGHRDFLKNTIRGLQGVDIAVLVVAADDGVMPQTREHLDILSFFQVQDGFVVLSKADCVDSEILELAELEIMELTDGTFLEGKPVIRFSALDGSGSNEAMAALDLIIAKIKKKQPDRPFRLWIDQVRGLPGVGTVVSGTVLSGTVKVNDELQILPDKISTRVRSLEEHGCKIDEAVAGQRIGLNLHKIGLADIRRGMCLIQPGKFQTSCRFNVEMQPLRHTGEIIKDRQKVKLYFGTSIHNATVKFISPVPPVKSGRSLVQFQLKKSAAVAAGVHYVVSPLNRNTIIAGGRVLELAEEKIRKANKPRTTVRLNALLANDLSGYVEQLCLLHPGQLINPQQLISTTVWSQESLKRYIESRIGKGELILLTDGRMARTREIAQFKNIFAEIITKAFKCQQDREPVQIREILHKCNPPCHEDLASLVVKDLCRDGKWVKEKGGIRPAAFKQKIPEKLAQVAESLLRYADKQGVRPFSAEYFIKITTEEITLPQIQRTLDFFCKTEKMVRLKNNRYLTMSAMLVIKKKVRCWVEENGEICLRDCKDALGFNRGLGLPVLEYLDQIGFTVQHGQGRIVIDNDSKHNIR